VQLRRPRPRHCPLEELIVREVSVLFVGFRSGLGRRWRRLGLGRRFELL